MNKMLYVYAAVCFLFIYLMYESMEGFLFLYQMNYNKEKSHVKAFQKTIQTIAWVVYLLLYQKIYKNMVVVKKNEYDIHYVYHGQLYKIKIFSPSALKRNKVLMISNENSEDVTQDIIPYLGPKHDFHSMVYRPENFKSTELFFHLSNGNTVKFSEKEEIVIPTRA